MRFRKPEADSKPFPSEEFAKTHSKDMVRLLERRAKQRPEDRRIVSSAEGRGVAAADAQWVLQRIHESAQQILEERNSQGSLEDGALDEVGFVPTPPSTGEHDGYNSK